MKLWMLTIFHFKLIKLIHPLSVIITNILFFLKSISPPPSRALDWYININITSISDEHSMRSID